MKNNSTLTHWFFYWLTGAIIVFLVFPKFFLSGMFSDGALYAAISKNLASGIGSFWHPVASLTYFNPFYEHPPLMFGLQAMFFYVFGDHFFTERIYEFVILAATVVLMVQIWSVIAKNKKIAFLPVLFLMITPHVFHTHGNNMLENTMSLFLLVAVLLQCLVFYKEKNSLFLLLSGFFVFLAMLTKGFPALFPMVIPLLWGAIYKKPLKVIIKNTLLICMPIFLLSLGVYLFPDAKTAIDAYFENQIIGALSGKDRAVDNRFHIIKRLLDELLPMIILASILVMFYVRKNIFSDIKDNFRKILVFFMIGILASFPLMISPKQATYYLVPSIPYFALALAITVDRPAKLLQLQISKKINLPKILFFVSIFLFLAALTFSVSRINHYKRGQEKLLKSIDAIGKIVPPNSIIQTNMPVYKKTAPHAYFARYYSIWLTLKQTDRAVYKIIHKEETDKNIAGDSLILSTEYYLLFKKKE